MLPTVRTLIRICLFKAKPQDLPASTNLLVSAVIATLILFIMRNKQLVDNADTDAGIIGISIVQVLLLGLGLKILLALFSRSERWLQSATALFGCSALFLAAALPIIMLSAAGGLASDSGIFDYRLTGLVIVAASIWHFVIFVFIFRETLEISGVLAFVIAFVLELSFATILISLFGEQLL